MHQWTIELKRDADYWQDQVTVRDEVGSLVVFSETEITIHPDKGEDGTEYNDEIWNPSNGKLLIVSDGVFGFEVSMAEIAAYQWSTGRFCWSVTYSDGHKDGSWMIGRVKVKKACL